MTGCLGWRPRREPGARSTPATTIPAPRLTDYRTGEDIRTATSEEVEASKAAAETDGGGGEGLERKVCSRRNGETRRREHTAR